jgi:hypothetical protein
MSTVTSLSITDLLANAPAVEAKPDKDGTPDVAAPDLLAQCKLWLDADAAIKKAEQTKKELGAMLCAVAEPQRRELCRKGKHTSSVKLNGLVTYICQNKYGKIPITLEPTLRAALPAFATQFTIEQAVDVDLDKLLAAKDNPDVAVALATLMAAGIASVPKYLKPTESFHQALALDPTVDAVATNHNIKPVAFVRKGGV